MFNANPEYSYQLYIDTIIINNYLMNYYLLLIRKYIYLETIQKII